MSTYTHRYPPVSICIKKTYGQRQTQSKAPMYTHGFPRQTDPAHAAQRPHLYARMVAVSVCCMVLSCCKLEGYCLLFMFSPVDVVVLYDTRFVDML